MTYRKMMIEVIKIACQDVIEKVDDLVPDTEGLYNVDLTIHIPTMTDDANMIPTIEMNVEGYTTRLATEKILELIRNG